MAQTGHDNQSISAVEPVTGIESAGSRVGIPSLSGKAGAPVDESRPSSLAALEVAMPDLGRILEGSDSHSNIGLAYVVDRETNSVIVRVIDRETNEVVREIPAEEMTRLRAAMRDLFGSLFKAEV